MMQRNNPEDETLPTAIPLTNERTRILNQLSSQMSCMGIGIQQLPKQLHLEWVSTKCN